jgi:hypothetical protein
MRVDEVCSCEVGAPSLQGKMIMACKAKRAAIASLIGGEEFPSISYHPKPPETL